MDVLYTPRDPDWVFEPSFATSALIYETVHLPLLQTGDSSPVFASYPHGGYTGYDLDETAITGTIADLFLEDVCHSVSAIRSWLDLPRQAESLKLLSNLGIVRDVCDLTHSTNGPTVADGGEPVEDVRARVRGESAAQGLVSIHEFERGLGNLTGQYQWAHSLIPFDITDHLAIPLDATAAQVSLPAASLLDDTFIRDVVRELLPEVFFESLANLREASATERNSQIPRYVELLQGVREGSRDSRGAFREFMTMLSALPWEKGSGALEPELEARKKELLAAYREYRSPLASVLRRFGGFLRWGPVAVNILTLQWPAMVLDALGVLHEAVEPKVPAVESRQRATFAFMLSIERGMRSWAP